MMICRGEGEGRRNITSAPRAENRGQWSRQDQQPRGPGGSLINIDTLNSIRKPRLTLDLEA